MLTAATTNFVEAPELDIRPVRRRSPATGARPFAHWHSVQGVVLLAAILLEGVLIIRPALGVAIMWNVLIPVAPALIVVAPGLWRNLCPMATFSLLPRYLCISHEFILPRRWAGLLGLMSIAALLLIVPLRHLSLNTSGPYTALMLLLAAAVAFALGIAFEWRSGWCTSLCPIHPVEKLYGQSPAVTVGNGRCASCRHCTTPCPDSTRSMSPVVTGRSRLERWLGHGLTGGFVGFVWGWYQLPDYSGEIGAGDVIAAYLWPFGCASVSLAVYLVARNSLCRSKAARNTLIRIFGAAAVSTYYWYRIPALGGFGPYPGTGLLYDLTDVLPAWAPLVSQALTTAFFAWFLVLRESSNASWMTRPAAMR